MTKNSGTRSPETLEEMIELKAEMFGNRLTASIVRWFRNDTFFDGFRNTPARIIICTLSFIVLYGGLIVGWSTQNILLEYIIALLVVLVMQAISVRFVFQIEGREILDEYQTQRRDRAYRRAYKNIRSIIVAGVVGWLAYTYIRENADIELGGWELLTYQRAATIAVFAIGLISLQKYLAYGIKGEPFMSRDEVKKMRNS
ncbi:MAG: hypothetical protein EBU08_09385 [Micrococcales bacterium]|nr:hypothetical protein [Microbacteriaceae bacterium]NBR23964.1 hypothetical protein [Micrococcales bacterium]NBS61737.1 hypothetical protein [Microbacteriaceae bacterium]NBS85970.1 hypothetical protein [Micrococcales bacterium]NBX94755.1 hypothetical protein [Actinomycetota bacterium]